jgi:cytochrome c biogenesis protein CcdA
MSHLLQCVPTVLTQPTFWAITGAALVDSINPCAIAVLLLLLTGLLSTQHKQNILRAGLMFIAGLFVAYYLAGVGLLGAVHLTGFAPILHKLVAIIAVLVGLANIKDFFWYGGMGFVTEIPRSWRPRIKKLLSGIVTPWTAFVAGILVTFFELPCTGGPYLFTLGLLGEGFSWLSALGILVYYNLLFVSPLVVILLAIYWGYSTAARTTSWKDENIKILHLIAGLIMLGLGVWLWLV